MQETKPKIYSWLRDKASLTLPGIYVIALLGMSMLSNPLFSGRPAGDAKMHMVLALMGVLGMLLCQLISRQQQRIEQLERRLAALTDVGGAP